MDDYYKILELDENCSSSDIKKSYRKLALKHHPDKNNGDDTVFKKISEAYEILSDDNKKSQYDYNRSNGVNFPFSHTFQNPTDLFQQIFQNSDFDMIMSKFSNNMFDEFIFKSTGNSPRKLYTETTITTVSNNGKKYVKKTTNNNGLVKTEEKYYDENPFNRLNHF